MSSHPVTLTIPLDTANAVGSFAPAVSHRPQRPTFSTDVNVISTRPICMANNGARRKELWRPESHLPLARIDERNHDTVLL